MRCGAALPRLSVPATLYNAKKERKREEKRKKERKRGGKKGGRREGKEGRKKNILSVLCGVMYWVCKMWVHAVAQEGGELDHAATVPRSQRCCLSHTHTFPTHHATIS